jgi:hypothetical protein
LYASKTQRDASIHVCVALATSSSCAMLLHRVAWVREEANGEQQGKPFGRRARREKAFAYRVKMAYRKHIVAPSYRACAHHAHCIKAHSLFSYFTVRLPEGREVSAEGATAAVGPRRPPSRVVGKANRPARVIDRQPDEVVASLFSGCTRGAGLVIQCLARFQDMPRAWMAVRMVSPLTRRGVMPSAKQASAASASVQMLVGLSKTRGLWCSRVRSWLRRASSAACSSAVNGRTKSGACTSTSIPHARVPPLELH